MTMTYNVNGIERYDMNGDNKDFIIEKLERKLKEKDLEIEETKRSLHDSILNELRNDLDINNRLLKLENKIQELSTNYNGVMDELLDQKSLIYSLKKSLSEKKENVSTEDSIKNVAEIVSNPDIQKAININPVGTSSFSLKSIELPKIEQDNTRLSLNRSFKLRGIQSEAVKPSKIEKSTEYIIAESDDSHKYRNMNKKTASNYNCDYIVAKDNRSRKKLEVEEIVESHDNEDAEVTVIRRK